MKLPTLIILLYMIMMFAAKTQINHNNDMLLQQQMATELTRLAKHAVKPVNLEHVRCLATNIYHEAGGEPFMGQVAVARVVMNRVRHGFASSPCAVVYQSTKVSDPENPEAHRKICQFSWVCQGKSTPPRDSRYQQAEDIAKKVLSENKWNEVIPSNILFFHNTSVDPNWGYRKVVEIGNHVFYRK